MPRDLFGDVTRPSISIGNRKWYTVPVSLLSHSVIIAMFVVLPILAAPFMPGVLDAAMLDYITEMVPPPPPPPPSRHEWKSKPAGESDAAPVVAPTAIKPESQQFESS